MRGLEAVEQYNDKGKAPVTADIGDTRSHQRSKEVYEDRHSGCISSNQNCTRRRMENGIQDKTWAL